MLSGCSAWACVVVFYFLICGFNGQLDVGPHCYNTYWHSRRASQMRCSTPNFTPPVDILPLTLVVFFLFFSQFVFVNDLMDQMVFLTNVTNNIDNLINDTFSTLVAFKLWI